MTALDAPASSQPLLPGNHLLWQEYPSSGTAGRGVFRFLSALPRQLSPAGLAVLASVQLDAFPEAPVQWAVLQRVLQRVQHIGCWWQSARGSITSWRASCASFASLGALSRLQQLSMHAFHCPGAQLASALMRLSRLSELRLSGRVVLEPLAGLSRLTRLQVGLELCAWWQQQEKQIIKASASAAAAPEAVGAAGAVMVAADGGGAAAAAAAAAAGGPDGAGGGAGEVMLEDIGAIVDGLIGNLQEGAVPVHLQRIIERFAWSLRCCGLLTWHGCTNCPARHLGLRLRDQLLAFSSVCPVRLAAGQMAGLGAAFRHLSSLSVCGKVAVDGRALVDLAQGLRGVQGVQGSAEAGGAAERGGGRKLARGSQAAAAAPTAVLEAQQSGRDAPESAAGAAAAAAGAAGGGVRSLGAAAGGGAGPLLCLSLDCHFVAVSAEQMQAALQHLQGLKVLCLRHRGAGKLPLPMNLAACPVLDVAVPENAEGSLPRVLLRALLALPRLTHLHIATHHAPQQLLRLTALAGRLRTLKVNYTGPPALPSQLLTQLREGLGVHCRVQVWEEIVPPSSGSFGEASGGGIGGGAAEAPAGEGRQRTRGGRLRACVHLGVNVAGGWWFGWALGGTLARRLYPKRGCSSADTFATVLGTIARASAVLKGAPERDTRSSLLTAGSSLALVLAGLQEGGSQASAAIKANLVRSLPCRAVRPCVKEHRCVHLVLLHNAMAPCAGQ
ncbi:hypothetical protein COO60DRAFT_1666077 [Scenedesmus sp. NREL 46B-D3]|nr:hypothetical protein COO60DRAFT_1666077 [Scenedesmus sp. NREL 46B-D3]